MLPDNHDDHSLDALNAEIARAKARALEFQALKSGIDGLSPEQLQERRTAFLANVLKSLKDSVAEVRALSASAPARYAPTPAEEAYQEEIAALAEELSALAAAKHATNDAKLGPRLAALVARIGVLKEQRIADIDSRG